MSIFPVGTGVPGRTEPTTFGRVLTYVLFTRGLSANHIRLLLRIEPASLEQKSKLASFLLRKREESLQ